MLEGGFEGGHLLPVKFAVDLGLTPDLPMILSGKALENSRLFIFLVSKFQNLLREHLGEVVSSACLHPNLEVIRWLHSTGATFFDHDLENLINSVTPAMVFSRHDPTFLGNDNYMASGHRSDNGSIESKKRFECIKFLYHQGLLRWDSSKLSNLHVWANAEEQQWILEHTNGVVDYAEYLSSEVSWNSMCDPKYYKFLVSHLDYISERVVIESAFLENNVTICEMIYSRFGVGPFRVSSSDICARAARILAGKHEELPMLISPEKRRKRVNHVLTLLEWLSHLGCKFNFSTDMMMLLQRHLLIGPNIQRAHFNTEILLGATFGGHDHHFVI